MHLSIFSSIISDQNILNSCVRKVFIVKHQWLRECYQSQSLVKVEPFLVRENNAFISLTQKKDTMILKPRNVLESSQITPSLKLKKIPSTRSLITRFVEFDKNYPLNIYE